jgi:hypothetical protein
MRTFNLQEKKTKSLNLFKSNNENLQLPRKKKQKLSTSVRITTRTFNLQEQKQKLLTFLRVKTRTFNLQKKKEKPSTFQKTRTKTLTSKIKNKSFQFPSCLNK